jgi:hypothetical protein
MTYDHWKSTEPDDGIERPEDQETETALGPAEPYAKIRRLRASHDRLLAAAREVLHAWEGGSGMGTLYSMERAVPSIRAAIAAAEEQVQ